MQNRVLLFGVAGILIFGGVIVFLWLTGGSGSTFLTWLWVELNMGWRAVEASSPAQKVLIVCGVLIVGAMLIVVNSLRKS